MEEWELVISSIAAIGTLTAALFSYLAVRSASESNKIAREQYQESIKLNKQNMRPVLDFVTKHYKVNVNHSFFTDWDEAEEGLILSKHLSNSYIELNNIGNKTARNVRMSFYYEGMDRVKNIVDGKNGLFESKGIKKIQVEKRNDGKIDYDEYWLHEKTDDKEFVHRLDDIPFLKHYGSIQPFAGNKDGNIRIYLPKLFVYLNNIFSEDLVMHDDFKIHLIFKLFYTDPFQKKYLQKFRIENKIRSRKIGSENNIVAQLIPEEILNKVLEEDD